MNNQDNEYNEYSNNLIHKNGKEPGFFGWVWIVIQVTVVCTVMILYILGEFAIKILYALGSSIIKILCAFREFLAKIGRAHV